MNVKGFFVPARKKASNLLVLFRRTFIRFKGVKIDVF
ncbi:hypothetical protein B0O79_1974 [Flavobacteriaceae bacterium MAR_2009_75]|nr:hypothetical protein B0O79_1974 [Flavobacteriaceae bacterium MAR_2009_75]